MTERHTIFRCRTGSHLYGLSRPESDEDFMFVFLPEPEDLLGLKRFDTQDNSSKTSKNVRNTFEDVDDKGYSLPKYLYLLLNNNPNIVESLFVNSENLIHSDPLFQELVDNSDKILSQKIYYTFRGYAQSQRKKLTTKASRYSGLCKAVDFLEHEYERFLNDPKSGLSTEDAHRLNGFVKHYKGYKGNTEPFHSGLPLCTVYERLKFERDNYGWRVATDSFDKLGYDVKFAYHLVRILGEAEYLIRYGRLDYPLTGQLKNDVVRVREGQVGLDELYSLYDYYDARVQESMKSTVLRESPDWDWANNWLVKTLHTHLCR